MSPVCSQPSLSASAVAWRVAPVALHDRFAAHQDLAVRGDPDLDAGDRRADAVQLDPARGVDAHHRRALGLAVALEHRQAQRREEQADVVIERGAARDQRLHAAAEARAGLLAHQPVEQAVEQPLREREAARLLVGLAAERHGPLEQLRLQAALARDRIEDALAHHLVEPRHAGHHRRPRLEQVGRQRLEPVGVVDLGADRERQELPGGVLVGVRRRQEREKNLVLVEAEQRERGIGPGDVGEQVAVAQHHALGHAAGARGVDEAAGVAARQRDRRIGRRRRRLLARGQRLVPGQQRHREPAGIGERLDAQQQPQRRRLGDRRQQRLGQPVARHHRGGRTAVLEQVGVLARGVGGVGRHRDRARRHDREVGDQPFRPVLGDQQHAVAGRHAPGAQGARQQPHLVRDALPRPRPVGARRACATGRAARLDSARSARTGQPGWGRDRRPTFHLPAIVPAAGAATPQDRRGRAGALQFNWPRTDNRIRLDWPVSLHICPKVLTGALAE